MNWKKAIWPAVGLGAMGLIVLAFMPKPVPVDMERVERGLMRVTVDEAGKTRVKTRYTVSSPQVGRLERIPLVPGDELEVGAVLARITPVAPPLLDRRARAEMLARISATEATRQRAQTNVEQARLALEYAKKELEKIRQLAQENSVSKRDLERAEMEEQSRKKELEAAEFSAQTVAHELQLAKASLLQVDKGESTGEALVVKAPTRARVLRVFEESERIVTQGMPLLELADTSSIEMVVDVLSTDAVQIRPGAEVFIHRWGGQRELKGRVVRVEPSAFTKQSALGVEEQRVNVVVEFTEPVKDLTLGDRFRVEARIVVWEKADAVKVPASALFRHEGKWAVFAVVDGKAVRRPIEVGQRNGQEAEVLNGLQAGDTVVLYPSDNLDDQTGVVAR